MLTKDSETTKHAYAPRVTIGYAECQLVNVNVKDHLQFVNQASGPVPVKLLSWLTFWSQVDPGAAPDNTGNAPDESVLAQ